MIKKYIILIGSILLFGCSTKNYELEIRESATVGSFANSCELVSKVEDILIDDSMIVDSNIIVDDYRVICPDMDVNTIGEVTLKYSVNGVYISKNIIIMDDIPPVLEVKNTYEVEVDNEYFDLKREVSATDNFSTDINIFINGTYDVTKVGNYKVSVSASDESGNIDKKDVTISVIEKEKEIIIIPPVPTSKPGNQGSGQIAPGLNDNPDQGSSPGLQPTSKPNQSPFINGVKNVSLAVGSSIHDLTFLLQSGVSASASFSIDYAEVNLSVPGSYKVYYIADDGASASCEVSVQ